ncbi:MAG: alpha-N-arabinofuranosidase, partial [Thermogutta sp.]|nr:alpha-N-arabinofuranosidase [Thermogutta sp.]
MTIDASQTAPPISKYIYGQFIEHLGRCIYGGIWAEMLVDRKFFYPVGSKESPWTVIGPAESVTMDRHQPFVGVHSPRVTLKGDGTVAGIAHGGLGILAGKEYVGYIWVKGAPEAAPITVRLVWGNDPGDAGEMDIAEVGADYRKVAFRFRPSQSTDDARLEIVSKGKGHFYVGTVSLMPADNIHGMRADTIALLKELDSPIYRWPGGNF